MHKFFGILALAGLICTATALAQSTQESLTLEQIASAPSTWPQEVTITEDVMVTLLKDGAEKGKMKIPAGAKRKVLQVNSENIVLDIHGSTATVLPGQTDILIATVDEAKRNAAIVQAREQAHQLASAAQENTMTPDTMTPDSPAPSQELEKSVIQKNLEDKLVILQSGRLVPFENKKLDGVKYYAVYFSAHWCPPCRKFTPELVSFYKRMKNKYPEFELVFMSSDKGSKEMNAYMKEYYMRWPAVSFDLVKGGTDLSKYQSGGIPNLVLIDSEGNVLSSSYEDGRYVGPQKVLKDISKTLKIN